MNTLFPLEQVVPEGFTYMENFVDEEEERNLFQEIAKLTLHSFNFKGFEARRKVASFGYDWNFDKQQLSKGKDIPMMFIPVIEKVAGHLGMKRENFAELLVTEYPVGSVINWHRDAPPFDLIAGISLQSDCTFRMRPQEKLKQTRSATISMAVKRRSLYTMQGPARMDWQHSTKPVTEVRYSITLRTLK
jgi:alkylated DNA repair dioxygenase AlkB